MYLLDTDTLLHLWQGSQAVKERLLEADDTEIAITVITKSKILRARCENLLKADDAALILLAQRRLTRTEELLLALSVIPFDELAAGQFSRLQQVKKLNKIGRADLLIASIALANDAVLVTRNSKHFRQVPGLRVENCVD
jgi:tRNA(fMet)-specific endonuclease VapC